MDIATNNPQEQGPDVLPRSLDGYPERSPEAPAQQWACFQQSPTLAELLRLLGDATRLKVLFLLVGRERTVTALCEDLAIRQPTVSHHLAWLRGARLVVFRRDGKNVYYALGPGVRHEDGWLSIGTVRIRIGGDA